MRPSALVHRRGCSLSKVSSATRWRPRVAFQGVLADLRDSPVLPLPSFAAEQNPFGSAMRSRSLSFLARIPAGVAALNGCRIGTNFVHRLHRLKQWSGLALPGWRRAAYSVRSSVLPLKCRADVVENTRTTHQARFHPLLCKPYGVARSDF